MPKKKRNRECRDKYIICCQGEETEKNYFESLKRHLKMGKQLEIIVESKDPLTMIKHMKGEIANRNKKKQRKYQCGLNRTWFVFDEDNEAKFSEAIKYAKKHNIKYAYSNISFEVWLLLHFEYFESPFDNKTLIRKIDQSFKDKLKRPYRKNDKQIYKDLYRYYPEATKKADKLLILHSGKTEKESNPSTTVFKLIEDLNEIARTIKGIDPLRDIDW